MLGLTILFVLLQAIFLAKHMPEDKESITKKVEKKLKEEIE